MSILPYNLAAIEPVQRIITISPSSLNEAMICMRKFNFAVLQRYRPAFGQASTALEEGGMAHKILERHYNMMKEGVAYSDIVQECNTFGRSLCMGYNLAPEDIETVIRSYTQYAAVYKNDVYKPVHVEQPFSIVLFESPTLKILFEGKIDLIAEHLQSGELTLFDHKIETRFSEPGILNNQFIGYPYALGFDKIIVNKVGMQKTVPLVRKFRRYTLFATPHLKENWAKWAIWWTVFVDSNAQRGEFPPNFTSCWNCRYSDVCEAPEDFWEEKLKQFFRVSVPHDLFKGK